MAGYLRVTHPFATKSRRTSFDLHVLGTPPAFILSQDQTLRKFYCLQVFLPFCSCFLFFKRINLFFRLRLSFFSFQRSKVVVGDGFEPPNPKEQIYSLPRLASSLPNQLFIFLHVSTNVLAYYIPSNKGSQVLF